MRKTCHRLRKQDDGDRSLLAKFNFLIFFGCFTLELYDVTIMTLFSPSSLFFQVDPYSIYHSFSIINTLSLWHIPELSWETCSLYYLHPFV